MSSIFAFVSRSAFEDVWVEKIYARNLSFGGVWESSMVVGRKEVGWSEAAQQRLLDYSRYPLGWRVFVGGKSFQVPCFETRTRVPFFSRLSPLFSSCIVMDRSLGRHILSGQFLNAWFKSSYSFFTIIKLHLERCNIFIFKAIGWATNFIWTSQILSLFPAPPFLGTCTFSRSLSHYLFKSRSCYL